MNFQLSNHGSRFAGSSWFPGSQSADSQCMSSVSRSGSHQVAWAFSSCSAKFWPSTSSVAFERIQSLTWGQNIGSNFRSDTTKTDSVQEARTCDPADSSWALHGFKEAYYNQNLTHFLSLWQASRKCGLIESYARLPWQWHLLCEIVLTCSLYVLSNTVCPGYSGISTGSVLHSQGCTLAFWDSLCTFPILPSTSAGEWGFGQFWGEVSILVASSLHRFDVVINMGKYFGSVLEDQLQKWLRIREVSPLLFSEA